MQLQENLKNIKEKHGTEQPQLYLFDLFFYIVLDNVSSILKIER